MKPIPSGIDLDPGKHLFEPADSRPEACMRCGALADKHPPLEKTVETDADSTKTRDDLPKPRRR